MPKIVPSTSSRNPAIQRYTDAGFPLFPLNGKVPPKGVRWSATVYNPLTMPEDFPSNFGVKLGPDDLIIDIDPRNWPKDCSPLPAFQAAINFSLKESTFTVRTGGGGLHLYFKKPADWPIRGALKIYPGVEFKTSGQYVVGAGSIHPGSGKPYTIYYDLPINNAPQGLLDIIKKNDKLPSPGISTFTDDEQTKDRFIQYLKTAPIAVEGDAGDKTTFTVAAVAHDFGLHPDIALDLMMAHYNPQCQPPWPEEELRRKVYNAYQYSSSPAGNASVIDKFDPASNALTVAALRVDQYGRIMKNVFNTVTVFNIDMPDTLSFNEWNEDIIFLKPAPWHKENERIYAWTEHDTARCKYWLGNDRRYEPNTQMIEEAIITVARQKAFHPIKTYLQELKWDGHGRLKNWLVNYMGVEDNEYTRSVGLKMLAAAIARIYQPGCKFDYIPVLEGMQGIGKSRALAILGGPWYGDITIDVHAKDTVDVMRHLWIIEVSEMETQYRTETQALRGFLSRSTDMCRLAYGRTSKAFPRQSIFIGTVNPEFDDDAGYLKDTTGNRRYWPVRCTRIDIETLRKVRDQLWAEAYQHYLKGVALHLDDFKLEQIAAAEQMKRMGTDPWYDKISHWLDCDPIFKKEILTGAQIYTDCLSGRPTQYSRACQNRIALIMKSLQWTKGVFYDPESGKTVRGYRRPI